MCGDAVVVDTNVGIAANGTAEVSAECQLECVRALRAVTGGRRLVLDAADFIFREYIRYMRLAGRPGTGDAFVRWVADNRFDSNLCMLVSITPSDDDSFAEFPTSEALRTLDRSDRKFVSVAAGVTPSPAIQVALDRGWVQHADALAEVGIGVDFLCPADIGARE
jgi:hypothetical protein